MKMKSGDAEEALSTAAILTTITVVVVVVIITIALSQCRENPEVRGKMGPKIFCPITQRLEAKGGTRDCLGWRAIYWRSSFGDSDSELIKDGR